MPARRQRTLVWLFVAALAASTTFPSFAKAGDQRETDTLIPVGVAKIDITPAEPIRLSGYGNRETESEGIAQRLWAKALAIGSDQEGPAVLITADLIGIPGFVSERLAQRLAEKIGLDRAQLVVLATHTHTGPEVGPLLNHFGEPLPPDHLARIVEYVEVLTDRLEQVALAAVAARQPGRLAWSQGEVAFAANRRVLEDGKWVGFGVNPDGPVDHSMPLLRVTDADGNLKAVLLNYACHCTTLGGDFNRIHGDWAGSAQAIIEENHPGAVAMVAIGCGADANPEPRGSLEYVPQHGQAIADEVDRLLALSMQPITDAPVGRFKRIDLPYEHVPTVQELTQRIDGNGRMSYYAQVALDGLARGRTIPSALSFPVQTWTFGDDLAMIFLGGEVVVDYALRLKEELDADRLWVSAYANDLTCYIASKRVIAEGGYEVDGSMPSYNRPSRLALEVEDLIIQSVHDLLPRQFVATAK